MYAKLASAALFGAAIAAPASYSSYGTGYSSSTTAASAAANYYKPSSTTASATSTASVNSLPDGFPNFNTQQLAAVEILAHGTLPNGGTPPPGSVSDLGITSVQLIEFNENFEVFFFDSLIRNLTSASSGSGFYISDATERNFVIEALTAHKAQEELHATLASKILGSQGKNAILPCQYHFGTNDFQSAIKTAALFTDVVLGTLQDVQANFAAGDAGDKQLIPGVGSVIGQEGEQDGFYRLLENTNLIPASLPFQTRSTIKFAFSALNQNFVVPNSCPNIGEINLPIFGTLQVLTQNIVPEQDQTLQFQIDLSTLSSSQIQGGPTQSNYQNYDWSQVSLVYINQQDVPITSQIKNVQLGFPKITFDADFPASGDNLNALTIAAVTLGSNFTTADAVANATLFGPGLIDVN